MKLVDKKEWKSPKVEVLSVDMTMASTVDGPYVDEAYVPGQRSDTPPHNRFTS